jgi:hypothetical protein
MGSSLLIATSLILAIPTAKWTAHFDEKVSAMDLEGEIGYAAHLAGRGSLANQPKLDDLPVEEEDVVPARR